MAKDTFKVAEGTIKFDREAVENLYYTLRKGKPDQDVLFWGDMVKEEVDRLRKMLKGVI